MGAHHYSDVIPSVRWTFYETRQGNAVVRRELDKLTNAQRAALMDLVDRHREGRLLPRESEKVRGGGGLRALKTTVEQTEVRLYYAQGASRSETLCVALAVIDKRKGKIPSRDLNRAKQRMKECEQRELL